MLPIILGGVAAASLGYLLWDDHKTKTNATGKPLASPADPQAGIGGTTVTHITPAGSAQPSANPVALPAISPTISGSTLSNAAAACVQRLSAMNPIPRTSIPEVATFQNAYNMNSPPVKLKVDGKYGPKGQAALQAVIQPAVAPQNPYGGTVALPAVVAPAPSQGVDIQTAATQLVDHFSSGADKTSNVQTSTFQAAYNTSSAPIKLIVDGKYGPKGQQALQSVLNWMGAGATAPKNAYGKVTGMVPTFPG